MDELDNHENISKIDQGNLLQSVSEFPIQCERAWSEIKKVVLPSYYISIEKIVVLGMGGSGIAADVVKEYLNDQNKTSMEVIRDYNIPAYADKDTLVIVSSYSGNTEETLSAFRQAISKKSKIVTITTNGKIAELSKSLNIPLYQFHYDTEPRQAFGFSFASILGILNKLALINIDDNEFKETITHLKKLQSLLKPDVPFASNQAKELAKHLHNKIVVILGGGILKPVARRFKTQLNENSKQVAFWEELPEACHNFIAGLEFPSKLSDNIFVLLLSSQYDHPRIKLRQNVILEILNQKGIPNEELIINTAPSKLSEVLSFIFLLDYASYYLAILNKIDPKTIFNIKYLKKKLEENPWPK